MTWARWVPGKWHRIARRYENVADPQHPYAPIQTACGKFMREPDHELGAQPDPRENRICAACAKM